MKFNIFPPETLNNIDPKFHVDARLIGKTLEREFHKQPLAALYALDNMNSGLPVTVLGFAQGGILIKPEIKPSAGLSSLVGSQRILVLCGDGGKLQFMASNLKVTDEGNLICPMPADLMLIQRRKDFRTPAPAVDEDFNFILCLGAGQELLTKVIDISDNGILLDIRLGATEVEVGRYWHSGYFERLKSRSGPIDLQVKNVRPGAAMDRIRAGCELYEPKKLVFKEFESTRSAIENARVQGHLNRWYLGASWYD